MARSFRDSRFRRRTGDLGEDVNPSAYIVNLADCMLVLACGFLVAMLARSAISATSAQEIDSENLQEVDSEAISSQSVTEGSGFVNAGTVWLDPSTGDLYMIVDESGIVSSSGAAETSEESSDAEAAEGEGDGAAE